MSGCERPGCEYPTGLCLMEEPCDTDDIPDSEWEDCLEYQEDMVADRIETVVDGIVPPLLTVTNYIHEELFDMRGTHAENNTQCECDDHAIELLKALVQTGWKIILKD